MGAKALGFLDAFGRGPTPISRGAQLCADLNHTRESVASWSDLRAVLSARCPGAPSKEVEVAAMAALCFSGGDVSRLVLFSFAYQSRPIGFVIALAEPSVLTARVGPLTIARRGGGRLRIPGDQAVVWDETLRPLADSMANIVAAVCAPTEPMLMLQSAVTDGPLEKLAAVASVLRARGVRTAEEARERHWALTDLSYEGFFATLSAKSRESFRQSQRKLAKAMDGQVRLQRYESLEDVDAFFAAAEGISRQTYQWQELGLGMRNRDFILARLRAAAQIGMLRCHILFCREQPVAFSEGFASGGVFLAYQTGYLPEMAKLSVGTVQTLEIMRDILAAGGQRWCFDWQSGSGEYKRRLSNVTSLETTFYLLPLGLRWKMFSACLEFAHACNSVSRGLMAQLSKFKTPVWWLGGAMPAFQLMDDMMCMNCTF